MNMQDGISGWLVRHAAASTSPSLAPRLEEEWLADLQTRRHHASRLLFALGCCWAAQTIAREFPAGVVAAAAGGAGNAVALGSHAPHHWSQRPGAMTVIIAFHIVVICAFANLFNHPPQEHAVVPMKGQIIDITPDKKPPLPLPKLRFVGATVEPLSFNNHFTFEPDTARITLPTITPYVGGGRSVTESVVVPGGPGAGFPTAEDHYPASAKRLGEQGSAAVRVCVDASGKLTEAPIVAQSTGSARLDTGAIQLAQAGSGHYRPAKENGRAVTSCFAFRVTFRLQ